jgi:hypothetical protein
VVSILLVVTHEDLVYDPLRLSFVVIFTYVDLDCLEPVKTSPVIVKDRVSAGGSILSPSIFRASRTEL